MSLHKRRSRPQDAPQKVSTKAAEGFFIGCKFSMVYALLYAPFVSKELSIHNKSSRFYEYMKHWSRATFFFTTLMTGIFAMRQYVYLNRDPILYDLQTNVPVLRKSKAASEITMYLIFSLPLGACVN